MNSYTKYKSRKCLSLVLGTLLLLLAGFYSTTVGVMDTSWMDVPRAIKGWMFGELDGNAPYKVIIMMRLPRTVMAVVAGIGLSISGVAMQGSTSNPLVSPFTVGISSAAAFGASMVIIFGAGVIDTGAGVVIGAFLMSMCCTVVVYLLSRVVGMKAETMILVGTALSYLFSAGTSVLEIFSDEHRLSSVVRWSFGTVNGATWAQDLVITVFVVICSAGLLLLAPKINIMMMGDDALAKSMGLHTGRLRALILVLAVLMTSAIISFTGVIGFVGLIAPHISRTLIGEDNRFLIPFSGIVGALLMVISDIIGRVIIAPAVLPVGVVISFLGVPVFLSLIWKRGHM